jgi:hypothetical protein
VSLTLLPLVLFSPNKFNMLFSTGSTFIHLALAFFYGPREYVSILFKKENLAVSALYVGSIALALYTSIIWGTYLSGLLVLLIQVIFTPNVQVFSLIWFVKQVIQGGKETS